MVGKTGQKSNRTVPWIGITWGFCLALIVVLYGVLLRPRQQQLDKIKREVVETTQRLEVLQKVKSLTARQRLTEEVTQLQDQLHRVCFLSDQLNSLDFRIHDLATENALEDFACRNLFGKEDKPFEKYKVLDQRRLTASFYADFPSFVRFLNGLERHEPALYISSFALVSNFTKEDTRPSARIDFFALHEATPETTTASKAKP
ncbi:hypothetical protein ACFL6U_12320 [Planctomycetota bacterium]